MKRSRRRVQESAIAAWHTGRHPALSVISQLVDAGYDVDAIAHRQSGGDIPAAPSDGLLSSALDLAIGAWRTGRQPSLSVVSQFIAGGYDVKALERAHASGPIPPRTGAKPTMTTANEVTKPVPFSLEVEMVEGEPRVLDTDLAKQLGMANPRAIRTLIEEHREELEAFGSLSAAPTNPGPRGGRPGSAFYLNRQQALVICMFSKTVKAKDVRAEVVHRFDAYEAPAAAPQPPAMDQLMGAMTMLVQTMQGFVQAVATKAPDVPVVWSYRWRCVGA